MNSPAKKIRSLSTKLLYPLLVALSSYSAASDEAAAKATAKQQPSNQVISDDTGNKGIESRDETIEEVIVSGQRSADPTLIDEETARLFSVAGAADDPLQAVFSLPGVTFSVDGEPVIRGSAPQDNAYYIDLIPAKYLFHVFGNSIFNKNLIHSFDLYPAAFPSQFGNATGGVIDVSLRQPRQQDFTTTFNWSFLLTGVMVESAIGDNQAFYASYRQSLLHLFIDEDDTKDAEEEGFKIDEFPIAQDYQVKYQWQINDFNSLTVVAAGATDTLEAEITENADEVTRDPDLQGPLSYNQGFDSQGVIWDWQSEDGNKDLKTLLTHVTDRLDLFYGVNQQILNDADRLMLRSDYSQFIFDDHRMSVGLSHEKSRYDLNINAKIVACSDFDPDCPTLDADYVNVTDEVSVNTNTLYIQDRFSPADAHEITLGVHYFADDYLNEKRLEPRIQWGWAFTYDWSSYIAAGRYSQLPELEQIIAETGNPDLTTVKADHYVWGLEHQLAQGWSWKTDLYYKKLDDVVISISSSEPDADDNYSNDAEGEAYGIELLFNKNLTDAWYGWVALSLGKTERTDLRSGETAPFDYDKPVMLDLVANYLISERWTLGIKWSFQSGGLYTPIIALVPNSTDPSILEPVYGDYNSQRLPHYHRLDFRAEYLRPVNWGHWSFFIDIINAYNRTNIEAYEYAPNENDNTLSSNPPGFGNDIPVESKEMIGFFPSLGFEIQF